MSEAMTDFRSEPPAPDVRRDPGSAREALAEMAAQVRLLDQAAALAAIRVGEAAGSLRSDAGGDFRSELLADLGSSLVERVNDIHAECVRLSGMLDRATKLSARQGDVEPAPAAPPGPRPVEVATVPQVFKPATSNGTAAAPEPESAPDPEQAPEPGPPPARPPDRRRSPGQTTPEGVRLAATQMAVAGSTRAEIERVLRIQFGVHDADAALDEIFGTRSSEVR